MTRTKGLFYDLLGNVVKNVFPEATYSMSIRDTIVRASTVIGGGGAFVITLPPVAKAAYRMYSIMMAALNGSEYITLEDYKNDAGFSNVTLNAVNDQILLYSDGYFWYTLASSGI